MSEAEALMEIATAISKLSNNVAEIGILLLLFLLFKNMGGK